MRLFGARRSGSCLDQQDQARSGARKLYLREQGLSLITRLCLDPSASSLGIKQCRIVWQGKASHVFVESTHPASCVSDKKNTIKCRPHVSASHQRLTILASSSHQSIPDLEVDDRGCRGMCWNLHGGKSPESVFLADRRVWTNTTH